MPKFYEIVAQENGPAQIYIHSQIGMNWFGEGLDSQGFIDEVDALGEVSEIELHINSPGGNVNDGVAIFNHLKQHQAKVIGYVDGVAASIASVVLMAADEIIMPLGSTLFVHNPLTWAIGDADEMRWTAEHLDKVKSSILDIYVDRTGMKAEEVSDLMTSETSMTAKEAVEWGFADRTEEYDRPVFNIFDRDELKAQVMAMAQSKVQDTEITSLKEQLVQAKTEIENLKKKPDAASAVDVITACKEAALPNLAMQFVEQGLSMDAVSNNLKIAGAVNDLCKATGIEEDAGPVLATLNEPVQMLRVALNAQAVVFERDIQNQLASGESDHGWKNALAKVKAMYTS